MKKVIILLFLTISFCCIGPETVSAQKKRVKKARIKTPPAVRVWTIMNQANTGIHQKLRFTNIAGCQKLESWNFIFGGAEKLTVQAGTPSASNCEAFAQWESAPLSSMKMPGFLPEQLEFTDPAMRKIRPLTIQEGFLEVGDLIGHDIRRMPALLKVLDNFRFNVILPFMQNEIKSPAVSNAGLF